jgi:hypothetical protein
MINSITSLDKEIQVALIGIIGVILGTVISVIASAVIEKRAHNRAKSLFIFQKQIEVYPLALEYIVVYTQLELCQHQVSQNSSDQSCKDLLKTLIEREGDLHRRFFNTFWAIAPKRVRNGFESLKLEIVKHIKDKSMSAEKIQGYSYAKLSDILNIGEEKIK